MSVQCPKCFSVSSNTVKCLTCGFPISNSKALNELSDLNPLMIAYQSPIARETLVLPQTKTKPAVIKIEEDQVSENHGLTCKQCAGSITPHDINCPHCKTLIMRRYCSHCSKLIPDHATICPLCNKDVKEHFSYSKLRRTKILIGVGTAAIFVFVVLLLFLQKTNPEPTRAQADKVNKTEVKSADPIVKLPEPEVSQPEIKMPDPEPPVIHEIVPPPTATKSSELPIEDQKPKPSRPKLPVAKVEEPKQAAKAEEPKQIAKLETPESVEQAEELRQDPKVEETKQVKLESSSTSAVRPMLSPALQRASDLKSQQRILKGRSLNHKGYSLIRAGRPYDAIPVLEQAVHSFPAKHRDLNYAYALFNLAVAYRMAGKPELAIPLLQERIKINDQRDVVARELLSAKREAQRADAVQND
jgi:RNA polymerase subunit RPABC4/transcription elongation factor Spt4